MESELAGLLILLVFAVVPAVVILVVAVKRDRSRGKFKRQRITKGQTHRHESEE